MSPVACHLWGGLPQPGSLGTASLLALHALAVPAEPLVFCQQQGRVSLIKVLASVTNFLSKSLPFPKWWGD